MKKKSSPPQGLTHTLKQLFYPNEHNRHRPFALRHQALGIYLMLLLTFNVGYNVLVAHSSKVLGFATAISQSQLIYLTNQTRIANGVAPLAENPLLDKSAMLKAQNMFAEDYWAHYAPSGKSPWYWFDQVGYAYTLVGENLARDFDTSQGVIDGWMNSPTHRANMLTAGYKDIGIAVLNGVLQGHQTTLVVQHFGTRASAPPTTASQNLSAPPSSQQPQPTQVAAAPTAPPVSEQVIGQQMETPKAVGAPGVPSTSLSQIAQLPYELLHPRSVDTWGLQQTVTVLFLGTLMLLFIFDAVVIQRKNLPNHHHSHSFLHAGALGVLMLLVMYSAAGGVL